MSTDPGSATTGRAIQIALIGVIAVAFVGFVVGTIGSGDREPTLATAPTRPAPPPTGTAETTAFPAVTYTQMRARDLGPNRDFRTRVDDLDVPEPAPPAAGTIDPAVKRATLAHRESRRAYNGAPPVIPHVVDQRSTDSCMACHERSLRIGERGSGRIPHPYLTNCTQCHVEAASAVLPAFQLAANSFEGLPAPFEGPRAWPGAPPVVPHSTLMRIDCLSCHGPAGPAGMQTTHPQRRSCLQCHAPSAELDQYAP